MGKLYIGTSGWSYRHWRGIFYPEDLPYGEQLQYYSRHFPTTEVNSSFYHLPRPSTVEKWYRETPSHFLFAVKVSRLITHVKRLTDIEEAWNNFQERVALLKEKLGPLLLQFPPSFRMEEENYQRVEEFLKNRPDLQLAFEFRHSSWCDPAAYDLLKKYNAAWVIADSSRYPKAKAITADFAYIRMHGPEALFSSSYSEEQLEELAQDISQYMKICREIYVYFNNDVGGCAVQNAKTLWEKCQKICPL